MKIIIAGAGFAGIKCAKKLGSLKGHDIILFNKTDHTTMLASLPDVAGGRVNEKYLMDKVVNLVPGNIKFICEEITSVDLDSKTVIASGRTYPYDILVLAGGAEVNYFDFNQNLDKVYTLETVEDALMINREILKRAADGSLKNAVISGAGFTGLELGANLHSALKGYSGISISLIEKTGTILSPQEPDFAAFVKKEMEKIGLVFYMKDSIRMFDGKKVTLESGVELDNALLIWTSGLKRALNIKGRTKELSNGRLIVDPDLRLPGYGDVFAAGDCSAFEDRGKYLRMAVTFSEMMGSLAGENIIRIINKKPLNSFKPLDLGWILPVNHTSVGYVTKIRIRGRIGIILHFLITGMKNYNLRNFIAYIGYAFKFFFSRI